MITNCSMCKRRKTDTGRGPIALEQSEMYSMKWQHVNQAQKVGRNQS